MEAPSEVHCMDSSFYSSVTLKELVLQWRGRIVRSQREQGNTCGQANNYAEHCIVNMWILGLQRWWLVYQTIRANSHIRNDRFSMILKDPNSNRNLLNCSDYAQNINLDIAIFTVNISSEILNILLTEFLWMNWTNQMSNNVESLFWSIHAIGPKKLFLMSKCMTVWAKNEWCNLNISIVTTDQWIAYDLLVEEITDWDRLGLLFLVESKTNLLTVEGEGGLFRLQRQCHYLVVNMGPLLVITFCSDVGEECFALLSPFSAVQWNEDQEIHLKIRNVRILGIQVMISFFLCLSLH